MLAAAAAAAATDSSGDCSASVLVFRLLFCSSVSVIAWTHARQKDAIPLFPPATRARRLARCIHIPKVTLGLAETTMDARPISPLGRLGPLSQIPLAILIFIPPFLRYGRGRVVERLRSGVEERAQTRPGRRRKSRWYIGQRHVCVDVK